MIGPNGVARRAPNVPARGRGVWVMLKGPGGPQRLVAWRPVLPVPGSRGTPSPGVGCGRGAGAEVREDQ